MAYPNNTNSEILQNGATSPEIPDDIQDIDLFSEIKHLHLQN